MFLLQFQEQKFKKRINKKKCSTMLIFNSN